MMGKEANHYTPESQVHPIQLLVNYWEIRPALMGARLTNLLRLGVTHVATFVPWQAVESDISHSLVRFLQAISDRKMTVSLILTPEVGVHYANSGLPKDLFSKPENTAKHSGDQVIPCTLPPNNFVLPSLAAPEFTKRYHNFLSRMDTLLAELGKTQPVLLKSVTTVLTGSYWKYYRAAKDSVSSGPGKSGAFSGPTGDYSGSSEVVYRQQMQQFYSQREFLQPNAASANRWKTRAMDDINRRWFYQNSEDVFRNRSTQFLRKKAAAVNTSQIELYTPEADPAYQYSNFIQMLTGKGTDFARLSSLIDEANSRATLVGDHVAPACIHWTSMGGFATLSDSEKQFLILKSLLLMGGRGGGLLIDEAQWFTLSASFRARSEAIVRSLVHKDLKSRTKAYYLTPHLWSSGAGEASAIQDEFRKAAGSQMRVISALGFLQKDRDAKLVVVDPSFIMTRDNVQKLAAFAKSGRIVALPRTSLYTEAGRAELELALSEVAGTKQDLTISIGVSYRLHQIGNGKLIVYDMPEGTPEKVNSAWAKFIASILSVSEIKTEIRVSDGRLDLIALDRKNGGVGLFILNGSQKAVSGDILFSGEVTVSDLTLSLSGEKNASDGAGIPASRFGLEVPPCGVLPVAVNGIGGDAEESQAANLTDELMKHHAVEAAVNELSGFGEEQELEAPWN